MGDEQSQSASEETQKIATVSGAILEAFFDELTKADGLAEIAASLRKVVMEDGVLTEPGVQAALFPDMQ